MENTGDPSSIGSTRVSEKQLALLQKCVGEGDAAKWNEWREANPDAEIRLQGARIAEEGERPELRGINLRGANLMRARMSGAILVGADLRNADLTGARLSGAIMVKVNLRGARLNEADLRGCNMRDSDLRGVSACYTKLDGETLFRTNRIDRNTNFAGAALASARVEPGLQHLLTYSIRRKEWGKWYGDHPVLAVPVWLFWLMSDYGNSTGRIMLSFVVLAVTFAAAYTLFPESLVAIWAEGPEEAISFGYALYFSIVTMTTLGFGDVYASPQSALGQLLLSVQVMIGYLLLGALLTRFAVLFTAGGPSASFGRD